MAIYIKHSNNLSPIEVRVDVGSTADAMRVVNKLIDSKIIIPDNYSMAFLSFDVTKTPDSDPNKDSHYPLHFYGSRGGDLYVNGVTAGFNGPGSKGTLELLDIMGFKYSAQQEQIIQETTFDINGSRVEKISLTFSRFTD